MAGVLLVNSWQHPALSLMPRITAIEKYLPLNLIYVATALRNAGHSVRIIDPSQWGAGEFYLGNARGYGVKVKSLVKEIKKQAEKADVVGFSTSLYDWIPDNILMNAAAEVNPRIFVGGWGSQYRPKDYLEKTPAIAVVKGLHGEALSVAPELVDVLKKSEVGRKNSHLRRMAEDLSKTGGIWFRDKRIRDTGRVLPKPLPRFHAKIGDFGLRYDDYRNVMGELVLPVIGSVAGCPFSFRKNACRYCAQHAYLCSLMNWKKFPEFRMRVGSFDVGRVLEEITSASGQAKFDWVFFVDDSMTENNFTSFPGDFNVIFSTRPDYLSDRWIDLMAKNRDRIRLNIGIEFFNEEDLRYTCRSPTPAAYLGQVRHAVKKLNDKRIRFKAFAFLQGTRKWKNISANIDGIVDLQENGIPVSICPTPLADFTKLEKEAYLFETKEYGGIEIPGFLSYRKTPKRELERIYRDLGEKMHEARELGSIELLSSMRILRDLVRGKLGSRSD